MEWKELNELDQIHSLKEESYTKPVLIFKHSTRCAISSMAISRLEREWSVSEMVPYFLDLISYRELSNQIAEELKVMHESPQAILLKDGKVVFHTSHNAIDFEQLNNIAGSGKDA